MIKNARILIWIAFIVLALVILAPNPFAKGYVLTYVGENASSAGLSPGQILYTINDQDVTPETVTGPYSGIVKFETNKGTAFGRVNGTLDVSIEKAPFSNIRFGLDIKGGVHAVIEPNTTNPDEVNQIISTLQTRINVFGLRESVFRSIKAEDKTFIEVSIAGGSREELATLLESEGKFEAKIPLILTRDIVTLDREYSVQRQDQSILVDGKTVQKGESFTLAGVDFVLEDVTNRSANLTALVFSSTDIRTVFFDPQRSTIQPSGSGYQWTFAVQLSPEGAQRFSSVTKNLGIVPGGYLDAPIMLYLDNELIDSLNIDSSLKGRVQTEVSVSGGSPTFDQAVSERSRLQSILRSGALPTSITIVQFDSISPTLGSDFVWSAMLAGLVAIVGVIAVVSVRYRKVKLVVPMVVISLSEVLIILGLATAIGWTVDLAAIAGIIAAIGTGIDSQIIILDQTIHGESEDRSVRQRLKKAFFIIFGSGGTVIGAMLPLFVVGFGALRGFALVTIIGVLVGILIARPAYGVIVEKLSSRSTA